MRVTFAAAQPGGDHGPAGSFSVTGYSAALDYADFDGDRHTDLVVIGEPLAVTSDDLLQHLYGDGTGIFPDRRDYANTRPNSRVPVITDADRDDVVLDGRFVAYNRGDRRIRAPEPSAFVPESVSGNRSIVALDAPGPLKGCTTGGLRGGARDGARRLRPDGDGRLPR